MKIIYGEKLNNEQTLLANEIALTCGITFDTARLLVYRNIDSVDKAKRFLNPSKKGFHNARLLKGIGQAVDRITTAKIKGENVLIFGDYDADGICASTVLFNSLKDFGINSLKAYVPERDEGYGINIQTIENILVDFPIDLLITVDCGISDVDKINQLKNMGIDVIVTDHHEPPEILPDCIKINPKIQGQDYPFNGLCGAGVAYKLCTVLIGEKADDYLDFVALATVADSMELIDENRDIVAEGLKLFNSSSKLRLAFKYLLGENVKEIVSQTLAYQIAPRINAGGRMGDANCALQLFNEKNPNTIMDLAIKLNEYNIQRQVECDKIYREAKQKILTHSLHKKNVILVKNRNWQAGFIGIVAAKLVEEFARPVIVFAGQDDYLKGSARSVDGINIYDAIVASKEYLLGYGGHSQAAGLSVAEENFLSFEKLINSIVKNQVDKVDVTPRINVEWEIEGEFSNKFAHEIELLEPFGVGNRKPLFSTKILTVNPLPLKLGSNHYTFKTDALEMLNFNGQDDLDVLRLPVQKSIVFELNISVFRNKEYMKGYVKAVCPNYDNLNLLSLNLFNNQIDGLCDDNGEFSYVNKEEIFNSNGIGTLYVINDVKNLKEYPKLSNLPKSLFKPLSKNYSDEIIISLSVVPHGYDRIIYLDNPIQVIKSDIKTYVVKDYCSYDNLLSLSVDRNEFVQIFTYLTTLRNRRINDVVDFAKENCDRYDVRQFLFVLKVFLELNIFSIKNGQFIYNEKVKNALTNSKVYSKIVLLKG